jgi:predicted aconitase with swiveling domain
MVFVASSLLSDRGSLVLPRAVSRGAEFFKHADHPVALVTEMVPDPSVVQGAILAGIPIVCRPAERLGGLVRMDPGSSSKASV